jgi:GTP cyclohydrolase IA
LDKKDVVLVDALDIHLHLGTAIQSFLGTHSLPGMEQHIAETPMRVIKFWKEMLSGTHLDAGACLNTDFAEAKYDQMIFVRDIDFVSVCAHHMAPFVGKAHFAYLPDKSVVGLSKIPRMIDVLSRRLQIQEQLTQQIVDTFQGVVKPRGCAVQIESWHSCVAIRGIRKANSKMITTALSGLFLEKAEVKQEFLLTIRG